LVGALLAAAAGCSSSNNSSSASTTSRVASSTTVVAAAGGPTSRRVGRAAGLSTELTGGHGVFIGSPIAVDLARFGYVQREYAAAGMATSYKVSGSLTRDGRWKFTPAATAAYRTRVLVRMPADAAHFSGIVIVEWLNVSGGVDADPEWATLHEEILRSGDAWVGVSAQRIGVNGGPVLVQVNVPGSEASGNGLRAIDPGRYGSLNLPGDGFSFDIFTQVARALWSGTGLGGLRPQHVIAAGESQSAFAMVTYYNGVQPLTHAFDDFFVHSRGAVGLPLAAPGQYAGIQNAISGTASIFRTDQDAPIMDVQTETDVTSILNSYAARQHSLSALGGHRHCPRRRAPPRRGEPEVHRLRSAGQQR
jgi:Alpha/beta hydrolase domain